MTPHVAATPRKFIVSPCSTKAAALLNNDKALDFAILEEVDRHAVSTSQPKDHLVK